MHPDGAVSPMKLLAHTTHPDGVIGSLLGGKPQLLACLPAASIVLMGLQDAICDDEWTQKHTPCSGNCSYTSESAKYKGGRYVPPSRHPSGRVMLGDLPLTTYVTGDCHYYVRQTPASLPPSRCPPMTMV